MEGVDTQLVDFIIPFSSAIAGRPIVELGLPGDSLIVLINRNENFFAPSGGTVLEEGDVVLVLVNQKNLTEIREILMKWRSQTMMRKE